VNTLDELEKLLAEATQGKWYRSNNMDYVVGEDGPIAECEPIEGYFRKHVANAALIVAAINALPGLIESARELQALKRSQALDELVAISQEAGLYDDPPPTRAQGESS
jgi:hypothetical protein